MFSVKIEIKMPLVNITYNNMTIVFLDSSRAEPILSQRKETRGSGTHPQKGHGNPPQLLEAVSVTVSSDDVISALCPFKPRHRCHSHVDADVVDPISVSFSLSSTRLESHHQ